MKFQSMIIEYKRTTSNAWKNSSLLDSRRLLKTIRIDASEEILPEVHVIESIHDSIVVAL